MLGDERRHGGIVLEGLGESRPAQQLHGCKPRPIGHASGNASWATAAEVSETRENDDVSSETFAALIGPRDSAKCDVIRELIREQLLRS